MNRGGESPAPAPDYRQLSRDVIRALRGARSQTALSRALGYRTNVVYRWEAGARLPSVDTFFRLVARVRAPLEPALRALDPAALAAVGATPGESGYALRVLRALSDQPLRSLADGAGLPTHTLRRVLNGSTRASLPVFFQIVEAATHRLAPFLEALVGADALDALGPAWRVGLALRSVYRRHPWSEAVLAMIECSPYRALPAHDDRWLAERLGLGLDEARETVRALVSAGALAWPGEPGAGLLQTRPQRATHLSMAEAQQLRAHWVAQIAELESERARTGYIVFSCSEEGLARVRRVLSLAFSEIRQIVEEDESPERAVLVATSLAALDGAELPPRG